MTVKEWREKIDKQLLKMEVHFENHLTHHKKVILPFIIAIVVLLISLHFRR